MSWLSWASKKISTGSRSSNKPAQFLPKISHLCLDTFQQNGYLPSQKTGVEVKITCIFKLLYGFRLDNPGCPRKDLSIVAETPTLYEGD